MPLHRISRASAWRFQPFGRSSRRTLLAATAASALACHGAWAEGEVNEAVLKKMEAMEQRIELLEAELKQKRAADAAAQPSPAEKKTPLDKKQAASTEKLPKKAPQADAGKNDRAVAAAEPAPSPQGKPAAKTDNLDLTTPASDLPILGLAPSPVTGLSIGAYGEVLFGRTQNPAAGGQWQNGFDTARMVLLPTYAITDNIIFNAEIEFEHGGSAFDNDDKMHGTAEIEQLWIDFKIIDQFNWRAPGVDLIPIGFINVHHEPTQFYSVYRPELYNGLIPSTWMAPATSIYGSITDGLSYQVMLSATNEDYGDSFDNRTAAKTVPPPGIPYLPGIDGLNALAFSKPPIGGFEQLSNALAVSGRLDFSPPFLPGFNGSVSAYYSPNTTPRGAHDDLGNLLGSSSLAMFDAEFRYRVPDTGLELRGEYVHVGFGNPANLRANNDSDPTDNVGASMFGYSGEIAYHVPLGTILKSDWEAVPFYNYTYENLQAGGFAGTDFNLPTGAGQRQFHTAGVAVFPSPKVVLKAEYQRVIDKSLAGALSDSYLGGVGFFF